MGFLLLFMETTGLSEKLTSLFSSHPNEDFHHGEAFLAFCLSFLFCAFLAAVIVFALVLIPQLFLSADTIRHLYEPLTPLVMALVDSYKQFGLLLYIPLFLSLLVLHYLLHFFTKYPKGVLSGLGVILAGTAYFLNDIHPLIS